MKIKNHLIFTSAFSQFRSCFYFILLALILTQPACNSCKGSADSESTDDATSVIEPDVDTTNSTDTPITETTNADTTITETTNGNVAVSETPSDDTATLETANETVTEPVTVSTWYRDNDGDGYGLIMSTTTSATQPTGYVSDSTDCNDDLSTANPVAVETCDGVDNNCNTEIDEDFAIATYYQDADGDGFGSAALTESSCAAPAGYVTDNSDCDDTNAEVKPGTVFYQDVDGDGFGSATAESTSSCEAVSGYVTNATDCNDNNAALTIIKHEQCIIDDDCTKAGATACSTYTVPDTIATCDGDARDADTTNDTDVTAELNTWIETIPNGTDEEYSVLNLDGKCFAVKSAVKLYSRNNITIEGSGGTIQAINYETCSLCSYPPNANHGGTYTGSRVTTSPEWTTALAAATADPDDASYKSRSQFSIELGSGFKVQNLTIQGTLSRTFDTDGDGDDEDATVNLLFDSARELDHNLMLTGPTNVTIDNVNFKNAWGNSVLLSGSDTSSGEWTDATDVTIKNSFINGAGQRAFSCAGCLNFIVQDTDIRNIGYTVVYLDIESENNNSHGDVSLIRNTFGPFKNDLLSAGHGQSNDSTLGPFVLQDNTQEAATTYYSGPPVWIGYNDVPVSRVEFTGNTIKSRGSATFRIEAAEDVIITNNNTSQLNYHAAYLKNVARAEIKDNTFTGAWGIAWFKDEDDAIIDATTANTTCSNNTMIGVVNNAIPFGRWTNGDTTYGDEYLITEGCETFDCRQDWDGNGTLDYSDC